VVSAFTAPDRPLVTVSPTFERPARRAAVVGAPVVLVPIVEAGLLDLDAMLARTSGVGLVYVCNPNNPTATALAASDVQMFVERSRKPFRASRLSAQRRPAPVIPRHCAGRRPMIPRPSLGLCTRKCSRTRHRAHRHDVHVHGVESRRSRSSCCQEEERS
jgi:hypothetical protein